MNSTFEEQLKNNGTLVYYNVGDSMMPLLREHHDLLVLKVPKKPIKKYDIVLYKRSSGQYVLHRVLSVKHNGFVICGDNRYKKEYGVKRKQILAVLTAVIRDGKEISTDSIKCKFYAHLWCDFFFVRAVILCVRHKFIILKRKINNAKHRGK